MENSLICGHQELRKQSFEKHKKMLHEEGVIYNCKQCKHNYSSESSLVKHLKEVHEGTKFPCKHSSYEAFEKTNLAMHQKTVNEAVKFPWKHFTKYLESKRFKKYIYINYITSF